MRVLGPVAAALAMLSAFTTFVVLADLTPEQWAAASLCDGWRIREVVAHITMAYRYSAPRYLLGFALMEVRRRLAQ